LQRISFGGLCGFGGLFKALRQPEQFFGQIWVGATGGKLTTAGAFAEKKLFCRHRALSVSAVAPLVTRFLSAWFRRQAL
jgi:hypothetical protein